jgi:hypothetical protein
MRSPVIGTLAVFGALFALSGVGLTAPKQPPACAAITFRALPPGVSDGEQSAGLYKSRFGRIEVMATVKNGAPVDYYINVNGKRLEKLEAELPASVATCAKARHLAAPGNPPDHCIGDKLTVLIEHSGDKRYMLLYAHRRNEWQFCSAGGA